MPISATLQHFPALAKGSLGCSCSPRLPGYSKAARKDSSCSKLSPASPEETIQSLSHGPSRQSVTAELLKMSWCEQHGPAGAGTAHTATSSGAPLSSGPAGGVGRFPLKLRKQRKSKTLQPSTRRKCSRKQLGLFLFFV